MGDRKRIFKKNQQGLLFQTLVPSAHRRQRVGRQMCQKTRERPRSHLVLDDTQLSFRGGKGGGEEVGTGHRGSWICQKPPRQGLCG